MKNGIEIRWHGRGGQGAKTAALLLARNRIPWLMILMLSSMVTGGILLKYEKCIDLK